MRRGDYKHWDSRWLRENLLIFIFIFLMAFKKIISIKFERKVVEIISDSSDVCQTDFLLSKIIVVLVLRSPCYPHLSSANWNKTNIKTKEAIAQKAQFDQWATIIMSNTCIYITFAASLSLYSKHIFLSFSLNWGKINAKSKNCSLYV